MYSCTVVQSGAACHRTVTIDHWKAVAAATPSSAPRRAAVRSIGFQASRPAVTLRRCTPWPAPPCTGQSRPQGCSEADYSVARQSAAEGGRSGAGGGSCSCVSCRQQGYTALHAAPSWAAALQQSILVWTTAYMYRDLTITITKFILVPVACSSGVKIPVYCFLASPI